MSWAIWITGRPGSGKSTIARAAADALAREGIPPEVCGEREQRGRWLTSAPAVAAARRAGPDVVVDYEESRCPDLVLHTHVLAHWSAAEQIVRLAQQRPGHTPADTAERSA